MADLTVNTDSTLDHLKLLIDMGDGTHAERVAAVSVDAAGVVSPALTDTELRAAVVPVSMEPTADLGAAFSLARIYAAASTNATNIKAAPGQVYAVVLTASAACWLKFHNSAVAPTVGTTAVLWSVYCAAGATVKIDGPVPFSLGISYSITGAKADADTTAVAAVGDVHGVVLYK